MTGAGQVCWISSVQESWYTQWELAAPPHQTQPYLGLAVRHRLQSERPTEQLNRVTETRERKGSPVRKLPYFNVKQYVLHASTSDSLASLSHIQTCTINSPHHTNPRRCQWGSSFFASRWSWPGIPPSRRNRHTETKSSNQPSKQLKRYLWCGIWADVMHAHVQSSYRMCQSIWLWELMKHDQGNTKVCTSLLIFVNMACHWLIGVGCDLPLCWFIVITFIMNGTRWVEFTPSDWVFNL